MENTMKRILSALLMLVTLFSALSLGSCSKDDGTPEGMQLVMGGENIGYYFWGPEEWVVANVGQIACTYASKIDMSSMTFAKGDKPQGTIKEYFESEKTKFPYEISVSVDGESCNFGNASGLGTKYVYSYEYKERSFSCMQIFVENNGEFYIFTYTASNVMYDSDNTYYDRYLEKVAAVIDAFKFVDVTETNTEAPKYERDGEGYILVSDETLAGFKMYVPDSFKVDCSSALVSVSNSSGVNITMSQATYTGVTNEDYWNARRKNIEAFADKVTDAESGELVSSLEEIELGKQIPLEGTNWALAYEYSYVLDGVKYHAYQVLIVESSINGYVYTYIAPENMYSEHLDEAKKILGKIDY